MCIYIFIFFLTFFFEVERMNAVTDTLARRAPREQTMGHVSRERTVGPLRRGGDASVRTPRQRRSVRGGWIKPQEKRRGTVHARCVGHTTRTKALKYHLYKNDRLSHSFHLLSSSPRVSLTGANF